MLTRCVVIMMLGALLNNIVGCYTKYYPVSKISFDEVKSKPETKIAAVVLPESIGSVSLRSGEEILFGGKGGLYEKNARVISGVTPDGAAVRTKLDEIRLVRLWRSSLNGTQKIVTDARTFELNAAERCWETIDSTSVGLGTVVEFLSESGRYDAGTNSITGLLKDSSSSSIDCDEVYQIRSRQKSLSRAAVVMVGSLGLLFFTLGIIPWAL